MMHWLLFVPMIVVLAFGVSTAADEIRGRIFNGARAIRGQFKYMAALVIRRKNIFGLRSVKTRCAGSIIGPNWVLTAAHCVDHVSKVSIYLGAEVVDDAEFAYEVRRNAIILHPKFEAKHKLNDIALIQIPKTLECDNIRFAPLPFQWIHRPHSMLDNMVAIVMGWGQMHDNGHSVDRLQWTRTTILSNDKCRNFCNDITENDICINTKRPYGSPCKGDSGGPLMLRATGEQIGITSCIPGKSFQDGIPVILTRVSNYLHWITEVTGITL